VTQRPARDPTVDADLVEYMIAVVPDFEAVAAVIPAIVELVRGGTIRLLDGAVVARDRQGETHIAELPATTDESTVVTTHRGLLSERDLRLTAEAVPVGSVGVVIVIEDRWAGSLADAARRAGGHLAGGERIPPGRLEAIVPIRQHDTWR
jgi:Family of unknown function (DUF6325)